MDQKNKITPEFVEFTLEEEEKMRKDYKERGIVWTEWTEEEKERQYESRKDIFGEERAKKYYDISPQEISFRLRNLPPELKKRMNEKLKNLFKD